MSRFVIIDRYDYLINVCFFQPDLGAKRVSRVSHLHTVVPCADQALAKHAMNVC